MRRGVGAQAVDGCAARQWDGKRKPRFRTCGFAADKLGMGAPSMRIGAAALAAKLSVFSVVLTNPFRTPDNSRQPITLFG
jgi:hypothetical protein